MDDRRAQLLRQRAVIAQHLAWLDAEIAATAEAAPPLPPSPAPAADEPSPADFIPAPAPELSKRGCWIIFLSVTTVLLVGGLVGIYLLYS